MPGTTEGGKAAAITNKSKYGADFYRRIGAKGGKLGTTGGFAANRKLASIAGTKGGLKSRRTKRVAMRKLYGQTWYKPMEIAKQGLIQSSKGESGSIAGHYNFVLELIKSDRLKAKNYTKGNGNPYYLVPESEIMRYHKTLDQVSYGPR
jgi:general stress protein YciG